MANTMTVTQKQRACRKAQERRRGIKIVASRMVQEIRRGEHELKPQPTQRAKALQKVYSDTVMASPAEECLHSMEYWKALGKYTAAAVWKALMVQYKSDKTLIPDVDKKGNPIKGTGVDSYTLAGYDHRPRPEDVEDIKQDAMTWAFASWEDIVVSIREHAGTETVTGKQVAQHVARRAVWRHYDKQRQLQKQGLLGPDFWHIVPDTRAKNEFDAVIRELTLQEIAGDNEKLLSLLEYLSEGLGHGEACEALGISRKTGRRWLNSLAEEMQERPVKAHKRPTKGPAWLEYVIGHRFTRKGQKQAIAWQEELPIEDSPQAYISRRAGNVPIVCTEEQAKARFARIVTRLNSR